MGFTVFDGTEAGDMSCLKPWQNDCVKGYGGAISAWDAALSIVDCSFKGCGAKRLDGGAVHFDGERRRSGIARRRRDMFTSAEDAPDPTPMLTVLRTSFVDTITERYGGAIFAHAPNKMVVHDSTFNRTRADQEMRYASTAAYIFKAEGGAITVTGISRRRNVIRHLDVQRSHFSKTRVIGYWGGGSISVGKSGFNCTVQDSLFDQCGANEPEFMRSGGGAVFIQHVDCPTQNYTTLPRVCDPLEPRYANKMEFIRTQFKGTFADQGGAVALPDAKTGQFLASHVNFDHSTFASTLTNGACTAPRIYRSSSCGSQEGGAVAVGINSRVHFTFCSFHSTFSPLGGALSLWAGSSVTLSDTTFDGTAAQRGGAVFSMGPCLGYLTPI